GTILASCLRGELSLPPSRAFVWIVHSWDRARPVRAWIERPSAGLDRRAAGGTVEARPRPGGRRELTSPGRRNKEATSIPARHALDRRRLAMQPAPGSALPRARSPCRRPDRLSSPPTLRPQPPPGPAPAPHGAPSAPAAPLRTAPAPSGAGSRTYGRAAPARSPGTAPSAPTGRRTPRPARPPAPRPGSTPRARSRTAPADASAPGPPQNTQ